MDRKIAEDIFAACERALASLTELEMAIAKIPDNAERQKLMHALASSTSTVLFGVRAPVVIEYPEIRPSYPEDAQAYEPTEEEIAQMKASSSQERADAEAMVLRMCTQRSQKVARVIGQLAKEFEQTYPHLPLCMLQATMDNLEDKGLVEIDGDPWAMRYSEIRLAGSKLGPAA